MTATIAIEALDDYGSREEAYYGGASDALQLAEASGWLTAAQRVAVYGALTDAQAAATADDDDDAATLVQPDQCHGRCCADCYARLGQPHYDGCSALAGVRA